MPQLEPGLSFASVVSRPSSLSSGVLHTEPNLGLITAAPAFSATPTLPCDPSPWISSGKADLVLSFLEQKGLEKPQIKKLVSSLPRILTCRIEENLEAKMNYFLELGISVSDFADIISSQPESLDRGLNSTVRPAIEALREVMGSNENVVRVIKKFRAKSWWAVSKRLAVNVSLLRAQGIPLESIQKRMINNPGPFIWKHEVFKSIMARAEVKWGVSPRSKMFIYAVYLLCCLNSKTIESKCRVFQSFGWDRSHVVSLFKRNPCCFWLAGRNIKAKLRFYMNELGYDPDHIIAHHAVLCYSLEKRVMPRYLVFQLLEDKGLNRNNLAFFTVLAFPEGKFLRKCILPFLDVVPDLHDTYVNSIEAATKDQTTPEKHEIEA
ncbi:hypothetical protein Cgig2_022063 [Carnegiea gigantea]|uniref:Uncharacterized protein n=1 Tax=Carnegiea gigantea TaxID=171969 RepID=A0A9Q1KSU3_9CARY|nr:hypothetical protein Cgig2_022063 [Carnegiea gigantea]